MPTYPAAKSASEIMLIAATSNPREKNRAMVQMESGLEFRILLSVKKYDHPSKLENMNGRLTASAVAPKIAMSFARSFHVAATSNSGIK